MGRRDDALKRFDDPMLGRHGKKGNAVDRVEARREDVEVGIESVDTERNPRAFAASDPVTLHRPRALRPARELIEIVEQPIGIGSDSQEPLREIATLDEMAAAPAASVDDLFVGEHGPVVRTPVYRRLALVGKTALKEAHEEPLVPPIVLRLAGSDLARPIVAGSHQADLTAHFKDVLGGPDGRVDSSIDRRVFGRQAERVPAHRMKHVVSEHSHHPRDRVTERVILRVADMEIARRVRQHLQGIVFWLRALVRRAIDVLGRPARLPLSLDGGKLVHEQHRTRLPAAAPTLSLYLRRVIERRDTANRCDCCGVRACRLRTLAPCSAAAGAIQRCDGVSASLIRRRPRRADPS